MSGRSRLIPLLIVIPAVLFALQSKKGILEESIATLNSKDNAKLGAFIAANFDSSVPAELRLQRLGGLVEQGAPFKLQKVLGEQGGEVKAEVEDREGMRLLFTLETTQDPIPKIKRVLVMPAGEEGADPPKDYTGWTTLDGLVKAISADTKSPAMAVAVIRNGEMSQAVVGVRRVDGQAAVGIDEPFSIGSIGKPICSTVIGKLIESGKLRWDTPLSEVLKDIPYKPEYGGVTIEQLMQHRGGIPMVPGMRRADVDRIVAGATDPSKIRQNFIKDILSQDAIGKPGEKFAYSNAGYTLLGLIAERVAGKPYEELVREFVFRPLDLKHSYTNGMPLPEQRPSGHVPNGGTLEPVNFGGPMESIFAPAGGGMYMSVADLARFGEAHLKGLQGKDGMLKSETVKRLHKGIPEAFGGDMEYASGWGIHPGKTIQTMHGHNGSNGTMRAELSIFPASGLVVAALVNRGGESEPSPPLQAVLAIAQKYAGMK